MRNKHSAKLIEVTATPRARAQQGPKPEALKPAGLGFDCAEVVTTSAVRSTNVRSSAAGWAKPQNL